MNARCTPPFLLLITVIACCTGTLLAGDKKAPNAAPAFKVHPLVFSMVQGLLSDGESPVVTEINLDAVDVSDNQFDQKAVKQEDGWTRCPGADGNGFLRYRVIESKRQHYNVEYQENGGGTLTLTATIEFTVEKREFRKDGKPVTIRVLRVISYAAK